MREWDIILNGGNLIWPTKSIKYFPSLPKEETDGKDSITFLKLAIKAGYILSVEPTLHYIQTVLEPPSRLKEADWLV